MRIKSRRIAGDAVRTATEVRRMKQARSRAVAVGAVVVSAWLPISRAVAFFFGSFSLLNILGEFRRPGFDATIWWIDLRPFPTTFARLFLLAAAVLLIVFAIWPNVSGILRRLTQATVLLLLAVAVWNTSKYYTLIAKGEINSKVFVPFSLYVALSFLIVHTGLLLKTRDTVNAWRDLLIGASAFAVCLVGFPLAQMYCFGMTDYRRPADAIVVFGCRAFADGRPSWALADRVRTGCRLYQGGLAKTVVFSGGPGDGDIHETEAMRRLAIQLGVPKSDIILDADGVNTRATTVNTAALFKQQNVKRVMAVSHFYHLPRIKLSYRRQGLEVFTVPAQQKRPRYLGYLLARETAALWLYYVRPLAD